MSDIPGYPEPMGHASRVWFRRRIQTTIQTSEHRELLLAMTDHRLMSADPKRPPQPQITNCLQNTCLAAAIFAVQQIEGRRETDRGRGQVPEVLSLEFY